MSSLAMNTLSASLSTHMRGSPVNAPRASLCQPSRSVRRAGARCESEAPAPPPPAPKWSATMVGGSAPFGDKWDPLGFLEGKSENQIKLYREAELTHGRVAMLASLGFLVGENFNPLFSGKITGPAINHFQQVPGIFWSTIVFSIALAEGYRLTCGWTNPVGTGKGGSAEEIGPGLWLLNDSYSPGDLGFDPMGLRPTDATEWKARQTKELNNGRLAMLAIAGMVGQELATGQKLF